MKINVNINNTFEYLTLFDGLFKLTDSEKEVLSGFVEAKIQLDRNNLSLNPFSTNIKKQVAKQLGRDDFNTLNTYIKRLKDKGAIIPTDEGYAIQKVLIPNQEKIEIVINYE